MEENTNVITEILNASPMSLILLIVLALVVIVPIYLIFFYMLKNQKGLILSRNKDAISLGAGDAKQTPVSEIKEYEGVPIDKELKRVFTKSLGINELHYLGMFSRDKKMYSENILNNPELNQFMGGRDVNNRILHYERTAVDMAKIVSRINEDINQMHHGLITRLVIDVQIGAVYFYELQFNEKYIVGVNLNQKNINVCDNLMENAVDAIRGCYQLPSVASVYRKST